MPPQSLTEIAAIRQIPLFSDLSLTDFESVTAGAFLKTLKHREMLYFSGDDAHSFCVVIEGAVKIVRPSQRGDDIIVYIATAGDVVAALVMGPEIRKYPSTVKSMGPSRVLVIPRMTFLTSWAKNAYLQSQLNSVMFRRMSSIQEDKMYFKSPLTTRISAMLINLMDRSPCEGQTLSVPLTRQEIADSLGVTVESVIRVMSDWTQRGIIKGHDKHLEIVDLKTMISMIEGSEK